MTYTVKEAKDKLSKIIRLAENGSPQIIRRYEKNVAVVVSIEDWEQINGRRKDLVEFIEDSQLDEIIPFLERRDDLPRDFELE
ncbi:MAG: type II toxin-antitoxin system Phd/YefM family antitoxin [Aridibacter sp.]